MLSPLSYVGVFAALILPLTAVAGPVTIDFEDLAEASSVSSHYSGLAFSNATVLTAGLTLDEFEFPPRSGINVAVDDGGPMSLFFASPVKSVSGFFTYASSLTLHGFDTLNVEVVTVTSAFLNNEALS